MDLEAFQILSPLVVGVSFDPPSRQQAYSALVGLSSIHSRPGNLFPDHSGINPPSRIDTTSFPSDASSSSNTLPSFLSESLTQQPAIDVTNLHSGRRQRALRFHSVHATGQCQSLRPQEREQKQAVTHGIQRYGRQSPRRCQQRTY